ncbi:hypothetical protein [Streptomyces sp. XD-27]|uniref:hypothetical protein n=1 Tax=Streptomyces sp. XD-27 TaxID=3062779 RepID=UPI0026F46074|nr:hypothetical protein [Streptomyces sp. XD-27]WKX70181.1 hypothetical protein Q3Y56_09850 [Streptomyces sp. XD-27]
MAEHNRAPTAPEPGTIDGSDGYAIEIADVKGLIAPLEESVVAAKAMVKDKEKLTADIQHCGSPEILESGKGFLSSWGYGMGQLSQHADEVVERLYQAVAAYTLAELLQIKNFWPSDENISRLPSGPSTQWVAEHIGVPEMEPYKESGLERFANKYVDYEDES